MGSCSPPFVRPERSLRTTGTAPPPCEPMVRSATSPQPSSASWTSPLSGTSLLPRPGSEVRRARDDRYPTGPASGSVRTSGLTLRVDSVSGAGHLVTRGSCVGPKPPPPESVQLRAGLSGPAFLLPGVASHGPFHEMGHILLLPRDRAWFEAPDTRRRVGAAGVASGAGARSRHDAARNLRIFVEVVACANSVIAVCNPQWVASHE
jgi:hypothetical protein